MLDAMQVRGMATRTQSAYIEAVARMARHYARSPDAVSADEVQAWLLHLRREQHLSCSTLNQYGCALRFFYATVLGRDGAAFAVPLTRVPQRACPRSSRARRSRGCWPCAVTPRAAPSSRWPTPPGCACPSCAT
jgi:integrase/recombinase XerD